MNLRQYRQSKIVQAAEIIGVTDGNGIQSITVRDADGNPVEITQAGLFGDKAGLFKQLPPRAGDWIVLDEDGLISWLTADMFGSTWTSVSGPSLSR